MRGEFRDRQPHPPPLGGRDEGRGGKGEKFEPQGRPFRDEGFQPQGRPFEDEERGEEGFDGGDEDRRHDEERLQNAKRMVRDFERGLREFERALKRATKAGVSIPAEYQTLVGELRGAITVVRNASELTNDVEAAIDMVEERGGDFHELIPRLHQLAEWPRISKNAERELKQIISQLNRLKRQKALSDYPELLEKIESSVSTVQSRFTEAKSHMAAGNIEEAFELLQQGIFEELQEVRSSMQVLEQISNVARMVRNVERDIKRFERQVDGLARRGTDVSELKRLIAAGRAKLQELKALAQGGAAEPEDLFETMQSLEQLRRQAFEHFDELRGRPKRKETEIRPSRGSENAEGAVIRALQGLRSLP